MRKADFLNSVKRKITPDILRPDFGVAQVPSVAGQQSNGNPPKQEPASNLSTRLGILDLFAPGGTKRVEDIGDSWWFSALQPIQPVAPASYRPRQRAFMPGENLVWTPGDDEQGGVPFVALRAMADSWDLLRLVIETRKDQLSRLKWEIKVKQKKGELGNARKQRQIDDPVVTKLTNFFKKPDGIHDYRSWLRMWFEDVLVIDAGALYYMRDLQGRIASLMPIDGGTISRVLSDLGTTPPPPSVAYQQVVYGTPACDLTTNDLLYIMRNERTNRRYGYSPVAQIFITISIALRRQDFTLKYYQDGNIPEALCFLPSNLPVSRIKEIQDWFDSVLAGNLAKRRRLTFLPGYGSGSGSDNVRPNVVFPKEALLKDPMDEWLMKIVCFAFAVSPQNLAQQMNRASAEQASNVSDEEGLEPGMATVSDTCNTIIEAMGLHDAYEFAWQEVRDTDPEKQATIDNILCPKILTINEVREIRGLDPRSEPEADMLGIVGQTGFVPLAGGAKQAEFSQQTDQNDEQRTQEKHQLTVQQQQQGLAHGEEQHKLSVQSQKKQLAAPAPTPGSNKVEKVDQLIPPGKFVSEAFGDLSKYDEFFAFDPESQMIFVKGDCDIQAAREALLREGHLTRKGESK